MFTNRCREFAVKGGSKGFASSGKNKLKMNILEKIIRHKRRQAELRRAQFPPRVKPQSKFFNAPRKSFVAELKRSDKVGIIAEFKRRSPSKGWINEFADVSEICAGYEQAAASAVSVLTDAKFFAGSDEDLQTAFEEIQIPILRKDFVVDFAQIAEARNLGASAILLIAAALSNEEIKEFAAFARSLELDVLLEIHSRREIPDNLDNINAIGVNNRNLKDFSVNVNLSFEIAEILPPEKVKISESGLSDAATILRLKQAGFDGFLIGEIFMKTENPARACAELIREINTLDGGRS
jgi:indole-3-glycerol phosphate synthase